MDWDLYVIIDQNLVKRGFEDTVRKVIFGGAKILQLRCKEMTDQKFLKVAKEVSEIVRHEGVSYIINDRIDIALAVDASGVHLGQDDLPAAIARHLLGDKRIIGISTHSLKEALEAESSGATYIAVGSIYKTLTKSPAKEPIGIDLISKIKDKINLPIIAVGGINGENVDEVIRAGATGVAVGRAILESDDITFATQSLLRKIREVKRSMERNS
ncbi:MAG: thiamine phosphate synthase [bacterium]|nr:thiamine phosphate synthase [bacterium]